MDCSGMYRAARDWLRSAAQYVGWSGHFLDYDNDGFSDLFITTGDLHDWEPMGDLILKGAADGRFADVATQAGAYFLGETMGRGAADRRSRQRWRSGRGVEQTG